MALPAQEAVSKGLALALDLGTPSCSRGQLALDMWPHLPPGAKKPEGAPLTLDLEPLALGAYCFFIWSPCLLHGAPRALWHVPNGDPLALGGPSVLYLLMKHFGTMELTYE